MKNTFRKICETRERKYTKYVLYILIKSNSVLAFHQWLTKIFSVTVVTITDFEPSNIQKGFSAVVASDRTAAKVASGCISIGSFCCAIYGHNYPCNFDVKSLERVVDECNFCKFIVLRSLEVRICI